MKEKHCNQLVYWKRFMLLNTVNSFNFQELLQVRKTSGTGMDHYDANSWMVFISLLDLCPRFWESTLSNIIIWHSCKTLLRDTLIRQSYLTRFQDTLTWHSEKTLLLDTLVRHSCLTLLSDTHTWHCLVRHPYLTRFVDTFVRHSYLTLLWDATDHSCKTFLYNTDITHRPPLQKPTTAAPHLLGQKKLSYVDSGWALLGDIFQSIFFKVIFCGSKKNQTWIGPFRTVYTPMSLQVLSGKGPNTSSGLSLKWSQIPIAGHEIWAPRLPGAEATSQTCTMRSQWNELDTAPNKNYGTTAYGSIAGNVLAMGISQGMRWLLLNKPKKFALTFLITVRSRLLNFNQDHVGIRTLWSTFSSRAFAAPPPSPQQN